jgi:hypothetical protein
MEGQSLDFKCDLHNESFATPKEFYEHKNQKSHETTGSTLCADCFAKGIKETVINEKPELVKGRNLVIRCKGCQDSLEKHVLKKMKEDGKIK